MEERTKYSFDYASQFIKHILTISAASLTFILTFSEKVLHYEKMDLFGIALIIIFAGVVICFLISIIYALLAAQGLVNVILSAQHLTIFDGVVDSNVKKSFFALLVAFSLLIIYVLFSVLLLGDDNHSEKGQKPKVEYSCNLSCDDLVVHKKVPK